MSKNIHIAETSDCLPIRLTGHSLTWIAFRLLHRPRKAALLLLFNNAVEKNQRRFRYAARLHFISECL